MSKNYIVMIAFKCSKYDTRFDNFHFMRYILSPVSDTVNVKIHWVPFDAYVMTAILSK